LDSVQEGGQGSGGGGAACGGGIGFGQGHALILDRRAWSKA
jgi:hypothetical protein